MVWNVLILKCFSNGMENVVELYLPQVCAWFIDLFLIFFLSGTWGDESEWSLNHQEKAEGHAEGPREAGEAAGKTREGGSTQCKTAAVQWLRLLRRHFSDYALHKVHHHAQSGEKCFVFLFLFFLNDVTLSMPAATEHIRARSSPVLWFMFILFVFSKMHHQNQILTQRWQMSKRFPKKEILPFLPLKKVRSDNY